MSATNTRPALHVAMLVLCVLAALPWPVANAAAPQFPALTGRVVDDAKLLSASAVQRLTRMLAAEERRSGDQVVVVTLRSLQGLAIADYGYQLGRHWGIGQKGKDNGALLIVAPKEHRVRIEVGYGLEGTLTDALCSTIINQIVLPRFRAGHMEQGVLAGASAVVEALGGKGLGASVTGPPPPRTSHRGAGTGSVLGLLLMVVLVMFVCAGRGGFLCAMLFMMMARGGGRRGGFGGGGFGNDGFGGGGFGGGGGSFGGGGASGQW